MIGARCGLVGVVRRGLFVGGDPGLGQFFGVCLAIVLGVNVTKFHGVGMLVKIPVFFVIVLDLKFRLNISRGEKY